MHGSITFTGVIYISSDKIKCILISTLDLSYFIEIKMY